MTHKDFLEWQFQHALDDTWWVAVSGHPSTRFYTLLEIKALKESSPDSEILVLHAIYTEEEQSQWIQYDIPMSAPTPQIVEPPPLPVVSVPASVRYISDKNVFHGTMPLMMRLAIKAIQTHGYKLDNANESVGMVTFTTGMTWSSWSGASCSLNIEELNEYFFSVSGAGKQNVSGLQLVALDFGEAQGIANKVISAMKQLAR